MAYYAAQKNAQFRLFEAGPRLGGNCQTFTDGPFKFDSGAHRFHDRIPEVTRDIKQLLGSDLLEVESPSLIYEAGRYLPFPISPFGLLKHLGVAKFIDCVADLGRARLRADGPFDDFRSFVTKRYGATIAERYLLNYTEKLWGVPCEQLSSSIAGSRLKGLTLRSFAFESLKGRDKTVPHLEGARYYYPRGGYGSIGDRLVAASGAANFETNAAVTAIDHDGSSISAIELNGGRSIPVEHVVSTIPLPILLRRLRPAPPAEVQTLLETLRFRDLIVVALYLNKPSVSNAATIYVPDVSILFSRIFEPRNRCATMAPEGKTSLVAEIPVGSDSELWNAADPEIVEEVTAQLAAMSLLTKAEVIGFSVRRVRQAYPLLEVQTGHTVAQLQAYLARFTNLSTTGRNGLFVYSSLHDLLYWGKQLIERLH